MDILLYTLNKYEEKLREIMGDDAFARFAHEVSIETFAFSVDKMEECDFKNFIKDHFGEIIMATNPLQE